MTRKEIRDRIIMAAWSDEVHAAFQARGKHIEGIPGDEDRLSALEDFLHINAQVDAEVNSLTDALVRLLNECRTEQIEAA